MAEEVVVVEAEPSMDETITNTLREINARNAEEESDAPNAPQDVAKSAPADESKARDASGKFVKGSPAKESAAPEAQTPVSQQAPGEAQPAPTAAAETELKLPDGTPIDLNRPPSSWKPAAKAEWMKIPESARADIHRRETEHHAGFRGIRENADFGQSMRNTVQPFMHLIQAEGGTPEKAVASMLQMAAILRTGTMQQKQQIVEQTIRQYGIQMPQAQPQFDAQGQPVQQQAQQQPSQFLDPRVDGLLASLQAQERERQAVAEQQSNDATERFLSANGTDGQPLYPFVDNVLNDMIERTGAIRRNSPALSHDDVLKQAYEQAVWANPETRDVLIKQQQAAAQRPEDTLRKVADAKRANANNLPKRGALPATAPKGSMDDTIRETYRELTANL